WNGIGTAARPRKAYTRSEPVDRWSSACASLPATSLAPLGAALSLRAMAGAGAQSERTGPAVLGVAGEHAGRTALRRRCGDLLSSSEAFNGFQLHARRKKVSQAGPDLAGRESPARLEQARPRRVDGRRRGMATSVGVAPQALRRGMGRPFLAQGVRGEGSDP